MLSSQAAHLSSEQKNLGFKVRELQISSHLLRNRGNNVYSVGVVFEKVCVKLWQMFISA